MDTSGATVTSTPSAPSGAIETPEGLIYTDEFPVYDETDEQVSERMTTRNFATDEEQVQGIEQKLKGNAQKVPHETKAPRQPKMDTPETPQEQERQEPKNIPEEEYTKKFAEMQTAWNKKFYNLSKERDGFRQERDGFRNERDDFYKKVEPLINIAQTAQSNPIRAMQALGIDVHKVLDEVAREQMMLEQMTPEQRQQHARWKQTEEENVRIKAENEQGRRYFQQMQQQKQQQETNTRIGELGQLVANLHNESGLIQDEFVAEVLLSKLQHAATMQQEAGGVPVSSTKIVQMVKDGIKKVTSKSNLAVKSLSEFEDPSERNHIITLVTDYATARKAQPTGQSETVIRDNRKFIKAEKQPPSEPKQFKSRFITESQLNRARAEGKFK